MGSRGLQQAGVFACWDLIVSLGEIGNRGEVPAVHSRDGTKVSCQLSAVSSQKNCGKITITKDTKGARDCW